VLLLGAVLIFFQDPINGPDERASSAAPAAGPAVSRRHRERQHLRHCPRVDPESPRCSRRLSPQHKPLVATAHKLHAFHPSAFNLQAEGYLVLEF